VRKLPADAADSLVKWAEQLADLAAGQPVEWSDTWSDEDLADVRNASLARFDEQSD
jgi:hypothetical protein